MIVLIEPSNKYFASYQEARAEYAANGITAYVFSDGTWDDVFQKFDHYRFERNLRADRVGADDYWLVDDERDYFIGEICIRHHLNDALSKYGGHIGYGIRYSAWNQGYGTKMLFLALEKVKALGISRALITCDDDNIASAKLAEKCGFCLEDKIRNVFEHAVITTRRYWKNL